MTVKRCPLCGGKPRFVHYVLPYDNYPLWWNERKQPKEYFSNRVECEDCKATTNKTYLSIQSAVDCWNKGFIIQMYAIGTPSDIEPKENELDDKQRDVYKQTDGLGNTERLL